MPAAIPQRAKEVVEQRLPDLCIGPSKTTSSALHDAKFVGTLKEWAGFEQQVWNACNSHNWHSHAHVLYHKTAGKDGECHLSKEHVHVGDEHGVQGRFQHHIGQVVTAILSSQQNGLVFADFKASTSTYAKIPDVAGIDQLGALSFVGELKTPWVKDHVLARAARVEPWLRKVLAQIAEYLKSNNLKYAFMSTFDQTIFVKQENVAGQWELQYSRIIYHTTSATTSLPTNFRNTVSLRQCMWFLAELAQAGHIAQNGLPMDQWVGYS